MSSSSRRMDEGVSLGLRDTQGRGIPRQTTGLLATWEDLELQGLNTGRLEPLDPKPSNPTMFVPPTPRLFAFSLSKIDP